MYTVDWQCSMEDTYYLQGEYVRALPIVLSMN